MEKKIKILAKKIVKLEKEKSLGKSEKEIMNEIESIINTLSFDEMIEIDNYIISKKLLTK